jgi:membrane protein YdbS with pleckstrin-like domain
LLNPDDDEVMKNISVSIKQNRGVRFSNDIQTVEIDRGPMLRKSKIAFIEARSCETIKNDLS